VQCVAQTCLEKGRAEEQVYGECKGEEEEEEEEGGNETDGGKAFCFTARQITGEAARLTTVVSIAPKPDCMMVMTCNVGTHRAVFSVTPQRPS
jgi:hypothetical protein